MKKILTIFGIMLLLSSCFSQKEQVDKETPLIHAEEVNASNNISNNPDSTSVFTSSIESEVSMSGGSLE